MGGEKASEDYVQRQFNEMLLKPWPNDVRKVTATVHTLCNSVCRSLCQMI